MLTVFDGLFAGPTVQLVPLTAKAFDRAAQLRADQGFKTADALHLAAAVEAGCTVFLTNDVQLTHFPDLAVEVI